MPSIRTLLVRIATLAAFALGCPWILPSAAAAEAVEALDESQVKALYVYRFIEYVDWRGDADRPAQGFAIGVLGADDVARELRQVVAARSGRVRAVVTVQPGEALTGIQVLFVGRRESHRLREIARNATGILIVSETANGLDQGAVINLVTVDGKVRFEISLPAAERNGLVLSSRLLAVALRVRKSMFDNTAVPPYAGLPGPLPALRGSRDRPHAAPA